MKAYVIHLIAKLAGAPVLTHLMPYPARADARRR